MAHTLQLKLFGCGDQTGKRRNSVDSLRALGHKITVGDDARVLASGEASHFSLFIDNTTRSEISGATALLLADLCRRRFADCGLLLMYSFSLADGDSQVLQIELDHPLLRNTEYVLTSDYLYDLVCHSATSMLSRSYLSCIASLVSTLQVVLLPPRVVKAAMGSWYPKKDVQFVLLCPFDSCVWCAVFPTCASCA